jgi:hypothetical protein
MARPPNPVEDREKLSANKYNAESTTADSGRSSVRVLGVGIRIVHPAKIVLTKLLTKSWTDSFYLTQTNFERPKNWYMVC